MGFIAFTLRVLLAVGVFLLVRHLIRRWRRKPALPPQPESGEMLKKCPQCESYLSPTTAASCQRAGCPLRAGLGVVLLLAGLFFCTPQALATEPGSGRYVFTLAAADNMTASLRVNGILTNRWRLKSGDEVGISLNHWLRQGANSVEVVLDAQTSPKATGGFYFMGLNQKGRAIQTPLLTLGAGRNVYTTQFQIERAPLLNLWRQRPQGEVLDSDRLALFTAIKQFRADLLKGFPVGGLPQALSLEGADVQAAYGGAGSGAVSAATEGLVMAASLPPKFEDIAIDAYQNGSLVQVYRKDGLPLVAVRAGARQFLATSLVYGRIDNGWLLLRRTD